MDSVTPKHPLVAYRDEKGLSQQQLAELIGVDRATVWRWENGRNISDEYLGTVSQKTGIARRILRPDLAELLREAAE